MVNSRQFMFVVRLVTKIREITLFPFRHKRKNVSNMSEMMNTNFIVMMVKVEKIYSIDLSFR